jgi:hypothetical protein
VVTNCESLWSFYKKVILITKGMFDSDTNVRVGLNVLKVKKPANLGRYPFNGIPLAHSFLSYSEDYDLLQSALCKLDPKYNPSEVRLGNLRRTSKRKILQSVNYNVYSNTLTRLQGDLKFGLGDSRVIKRPNRDYLTQKDRDRSQSNNFTILAKAPEEIAARPRVLIESMIDAIEADKFIELLNTQYPNGGESLVAVGLALMNPKRGLLGLPEHSFKEKE